MKYEVTIEEDTQSYLTMSVRSSVNQTTGLLEVCSLAVVDVGANLPCIRKESIDQLIESRCDLMTS